MTDVRLIRRLAGAVVLFAATVVVCGCQGVASFCGCDPADHPFLAKLKRKDPVTGKLKGPFNGKLKGPTIPTMPKIQAPAPTPPPQSALGLAPGAPPPGPTTVWDKLGLGAQQREFRRRKMCETPAGKIMGGVMGPMSKLSLGLVPPFCPPLPSLAELLDPGAIGASSKMKLDKMNAPKRKQAVEALKGADCHYWPEAEDALIAALRTDRNEGVRYTAALVLQEGKCCTNKTIEALIISSSGSDRDGAPCESSALVRAAAAKALEHCQKCMCNDPCGRQECEPAPFFPPEERPREEPRTSDSAVTPTAAKPTPADDRDVYPPRPRWGPVVAAYSKPGPAAEPETEEEAVKMEMKAYYGKVRRVRREVILAAARETLVRFPPPAEIVIPAGNPDLEAVGIYPEPPKETAPRPDSLFEPAQEKEKDKPAVAADGGEKTSPKPGPRSPTRPRNLLDEMTAPKPSNPPKVEATREPPRAAPAPTPQPPQIVSVTVTQPVSGK